MAAAEEKKAFKDWFDEEAAKAMSLQVAAVYKKFNKSRFCQLALTDIERLEFNQRVQNFASALAQTLPADFRQAVKIVSDSLPPPLPDCESVTDGWLQWPVGQFIADYGIDHFEASMQAMTELTRRFSSEYAVRPFVERYPQQTFKQLYALTVNECPHIRRWCSEGTRTRLPWGRKLKQLIDNPEPIWPILEALKDDPELYVRRSVANNLNDLSKDHPKLVLSRLKKWSVGAGSERQWLIKHALRTLIKQGDPAALALIGYGKPKQLKADITVSPKKIVVGDGVMLTAELHNGSNKKQPLLIDYVVHYSRSKPQASGEKVFKWKTLSIAAGESITMQKKHAMKATTIRSLYAGVHKVELQVNGFRISADEFRLAIPADA